MEDVTVMKQLEIRAGEGGADAALFARELADAIDS